VGATRAAQLFFLVQLISSLFLGIIVAPAIVLCLRSLLACKVWFLFGIRSSRFDDSNSNDDGDWLSDKATRHLTTRKTRNQQTPHQYAIKVATKTK